MSSGVDYDRPGIWRLRRLVQAGVVDVVLIEAWDRWTKGAVGFDILEDWLRGRGVSLEACDPLELELDAELKRHLREYMANLERRS